MSPQEIEAAREKLRAQARDKCAQQACSATSTGAADAAVSVLRYELQRINGMSPEQLAQRAAALS